MEAGNIPKFTFKKDAYTRKRGAPAMLMIICAKCSHYLMSYQKDGPGPLKRCYLDRICHPEAISKRQYDEFEKKTFPKLTCTSCEELIGVPIIYEKENRPAYHMRVGSFACKKVY